MRDLLIIGAGGFGREIVWVVEDINALNPEFNIIGFLDDDDSIQGQIINGIKVVGKVQDLKQWESNDNAYAVIGILNPEIKEDVIRRTSFFTRWATVIHPTAVISKTAQIGEGTVVFPYATVGVDARIGSNCFLNIHCAVGHDCVLEGNVSVLIGAVLCGGAMIGENTCIATNASVLPGKHIGKNVYVGAGSVVNKKVRDNVTVFGMPAQVIAHK